MSNATDIKYRIDSMDGGEFQTLCDAYLCCRGYGTGYSLGMKTGTNKTAKGNPDTYFLSADGKYIFSISKNVCTLTVIHNYGCHS